jgi:hypothetical protein
LILCKCSNAAKKQNRQYGYYFFHAKRTCLKRKNYLTAVCNLLWIE